MYPDPDPKIFELPEPRPGNGNSPRPRSYRVMDLPAPPRPVFIFNSPSKECSQQGNNSFPDFLNNTTNTTKQVHPFAKENPPRPFAIPRAHRV